MKVALGGVSEKNRQHPNGCLVLGGGHASSASLLFRRSGLAWRVVNVHEFVGHAEFLDDPAWSQDHVDA